MAKTPIGSHADSPFENLCGLLEQQIASGDELGASIAVNIDGKNVVDIWGGYCNEEKTQPWVEDTLVNVWSLTKTVTALAALIQVDRSLLDVDAKVSRYWPEFAQNGKEDVEVRHLLSHTDGVSGWESPITMQEVYDSPTATARLARQAPWYPPGSASACHAVNMGHLIGELILRTSGKSLKQFVAGEIDWLRVSLIIPPPTLLGASKLDPNSVRYKTFAGPQLNVLDALTPEWRLADVGAANGHGNARSLVRILSAITLGGIVNGMKLLSPETIDMIFREQANGTDLVLGIPLRWGIGFAISIAPNRIHLGA